MKIFCDRGGPPPPPPTNDRSCEHVVTRQPSPDEISNWTLTALQGLNKVSTCIFLKLRPDYWSIHKWTFCEIPIVGWFTPSFHGFHRWKCKIPSKYTIILKSMISGLWRINMWERLHTNVFILTKCLEVRQLELGVLGVNRVGEGLVVLGLPVLDFQEFHWVARRTTFSWIWLVL
jgi:hypothetical protein